MLSPRKVQFSLKKLSNISLEILAMPKQQIGIYIYESKFYLDLKKLGSSPLK